MLLRERGGMLLTEGKEKDVAVTEREEKERERYY